MGSRRESAERRKRVFAARDAGDIPSLIAALRDPEHRPVAATFLGQLGRVEAIPHLTRLLQARDTWARTAAVKSLGKLKAKEALPTLIELAEHDPEAPPRLWAIAALGEIGDSKALPLLLARLQDREYDIRRAAAFALGLLGDERAIAPLRAASESERPWRRGRYREAIVAIEAKRRASED